MRFLTNVTIGAMIISSSIVCAQQKGDKMKVDKDMVMIPAGEFMMGGDTEDDHMPVHKVYIDSFYMDKYEVTNAQYRKYCEETGAEYPEYWDMEEFHCGPDFPDHPVVGISWSEAKKYAEWAGKRLPTEAEWEYAARGGSIDNNYSYGTESDTTKANYNVKGIKRKGTMPVGSYPPNGYGLYDMTGNVVEWVADYYDKDYYKSSPQKNPTGPEDGKFMVIRGGGWHSGAYCTRVYFRNALRSGWRDIAVGFRCARNVE
jgi:iron(II)-dependent oxidoreductase